MESDDRYVIVFVTVPNEELGSHIAWQVVSDKLAACVNRLKVNSTYLWAGDVHNEDEELLIMKTTFNMFDRLREKVIEMHTYDVPEVVAIPIATGHKPYLDWITESVSKEG